MSDSKRGSVPQNGNRFTVSASPFNPVKLELGISIIIGIILVIVVGKIASDKLQQLGILIVYALVVTSWLIFRVRRLLIMTEETKP